MEIHRLFSNYTALQVVRFMLHIFISSPEVDDLLFINIYVNRIRAFNSPNLYICHMPKFQLTTSGCYLPEFSSHLHLPI